MGRPCEGANLSSGRRARFESLFAQNYQRVLGYALRRADPEEAKDVTSETFLIAWRRLEAIPEEPIPWLIATARNLLRRSRRSSFRKRALEHRLATHTAGTERDRIGQGASDAVFAEAFGRLREVDREVLTLIAWDDLDPADAALSLGISVNALHARLHRARRRLRTALDDQRLAATADGER
jgi:RNA polymerase sigma factor (sigma-70 family)